jgi:hypothetical protein
LIAIDERLALERFDSLHAVIDTSAKYRQSAMDDAIIAIAYARTCQAMRTGRPYAS